MSNPNAYFLALQFDEINDVVADYRSSRVGLAGADLAHPLHAQAFADKCVALVVDAADLLGDEHAICVAMADQQLDFPGAGQGYLAALGLNCGWEHLALPAMWSRVTQLANAMGSSMVFNAVREAYHMRPRAPWQCPQEEVWSDQTVGFLLLNGPQTFGTDARIKHQQNPRGVLQYYTLMDDDPESAQEYAQAVQVSDMLARRGAFPLEDPAWRAFRNLVNTEYVISFAECERLGSALTCDYMEQDKVSAKGFQKILDSLAMNTTYVRTALGSDALMGLLEPVYDSCGEPDIYMPFSRGDQDDAEVLARLAEKLKALADFFKANVPDGHLYMAALALRKKLGETLIVQERYQGDELWVQKALMNEVSNNRDFDELSMHLMYLKAMLMNATPEQVVSICDVSDRAREFGYALTGNQEMLKNIQSEELMARILEQDIGL